MNEEINMKIYEFIRAKKWHLISGISFLVIFALIMGVTLNGIAVKLESLQKQNDMLSSSMKSLESSSAMLKSSIETLAQNGEVPSKEQLLIQDLKSDLESILAFLSKSGDEESSMKDLNAIKAAIDQLNKKLDGMNTGKKSVKEAANEEVPDPIVPGNPAVPANAPAAEIIKNGRDITVTIRAKSVSDLYGYQFNLNFDKSKVSFKNGLKSTVKGISTIFKKDNPDYLLIGATMIGNAPGYTGNDVDICTVNFTATADIDPSTFSISGVSTVDSTQKYVENISGWNCEAKAN